MKFRRLMCKIYMSFNYRKSVDIIHIFTKCRGKETGMVCNPHNLHALQIAYLFTSSVSKRAAQSGKFSIFS
jgi:hypothetical protein